MTKLGIVTTVYWNGTEKYVFLSNGVLTSLSNNSIFTHHSKVFKKFVEKIEIKKINSGQ